MAFGQLTSLGMGDLRITLANQTITANASAPAIATATFTIENDGDYTRTENSTTTDLGDWMTPKVAAKASLYTVQATVNSGSLSSGSATGTPLNLSTTRSWTRSDNVVGSQSVNLTIEIFKNGVSQASCTVVLNTNVS